MFLPAAGTFTTAQSVTLSDATSGATIYYTTNGSTPTPSSTAYTGPITVSSTETLQAIAAAAGRHQQRRCVGGLHHHPCGCDAGVLTRRWDVYHRAVGYPIRCHFRRHHLLHHQRKHADHGFDCIHRPDHGQFHRDAAGNRGSSR